ncbi:MAG: DEAD/DEAH box helicase [Acidimicrobiales bacterium]
MADGHDFTLDRFQVEALAAIDADRSVVVSAPTGSGKTVVAEHAVARALACGERAFYTTPIKALSNQKYRDLAERLGTDAVGLLTGDNSINGDAPVVVMTTEVLRNMIYADSPALDRLGWIVLDEVHYLADAYRGPVWEEIIVHCPQSVRLVALSATISNVAEIAEWIRTVRGPTDVVTESRRPVRLESLIAVGDRSRHTVTLRDVLKKGRPDPRGRQLDDQQMRGRRRRWYPPDRLALIAELERRGLLPVIHFVFSRAGCDEAMGRALDAGADLTTADEAAAIDAIVMAHAARLEPEDLAVLGFARFRAAMGVGVAAHHAGMVPPFKEAVEECFTAGLVRVVYATETLALGVNMPARSVVIDRLTKFTGETHETLTPAEFTQLTGRAGRRGIDDEGTAVVAWSPWVDFDRVARLAMSRDFELRSAFRPNYNMTANLIRRLRPDEVHAVLGRSLAQFQTDSGVVHDEERVDRIRRELADAERVRLCELGDIDEWLKQNPAGGRNAVAVQESLAALRPGDIVDAPDGRTVVVASVAQRGGGAVRVTSATVDTVPVTFTDAEVGRPVSALGRVEVVQPYNPSSPEFLAEMGDLLAARLAEGLPAPPTEPPSGVAGCPDLDDHVAADRRCRKLRSRLDRLESRLGHRRGTIAARFDALVAILGARGYVRDGERLTPEGERLARIYHECDLLVAEALRAGVLVRLDGADLAAVVSCITYEHRSAEPAPPTTWPTADLAQRWEQLAQLAGALAHDETTALGEPVTRAPDSAFALAARRWAAGESFEACLPGEMTGGDFVRNVRILVDLLRQLEGVPTGGVGIAARDAVRRLDRGVVSARFEVGDEEDAEDEEAGVTDADT